MTEENLSDEMQLTKSIILMPLREALKAHDINENTVMKVFKEVMMDPKQLGATRLNACKMFMSMIGLVHESRQIDLEVTHRISDALIELDAKKQKRLGPQPELKQIINGVAS